MMETNQVRATEQKTAAAEKREPSRFDEAKSRLFQACLSGCDALLKLNDQPGNNQNQTSEASGRTAETKAGNKEGRPAPASADQSKEQALKVQNNFFYFPLNLVPASQGLLQQPQLAQMLASSAPAALDWSWLVGQLVEKVQLSRTGGATNLEIVLKPEWLGRLTLKLDWQDGLVNINLAAEPKVKEILETNLDALKNALAEQGVALGSLETSLGGQKQDDRLAAEKIPEETIGAVAADPAEISNIAAAAEQLELSYRYCNLVRMVV